MNKANKTLKVGDLFEIYTKVGFFYAQYTNFGELGYLLRLLDAKFEERQIDAEKLSKIKTRYYFFYPLAAAVKGHCVKFIGHAELMPADRPVPVMALPIHPLVRGQNLVPLWEIIDPVKGVYKLSHLNEDQKLFSLYEIVSDAALKIRLVENWNPAQAHQKHEKK